MQYLNWALFVFVVGTVELYSSYPRCPLLSSTKVAWDGMAFYYVLLRVEFSIGVCFFQGRFFLIIFLQ